MSVQPEMEAAMNGRLMLPVSCGGQWGLINDLGSVIAEPKYRFSGRGIGNAYLITDEGLVVVDCQGSEVGFIKGVTSYSEFSDQMLVVEVNGGMTYLGLDGKLLPGIYEVCRDFHGGFASVQDFNGRWGLIDRKANWVIKPRFEEALDFDTKTQRLPVQSSGLWELVGIDGKISSLGAADILPGTNGVFGAAVSKTGFLLYGLIDATSEWVVAPEFSDMAFLGPDNVSVRDSDGWANIGFDGEYRFRTDAVALGSVCCGLARAYVNGKVTSTGLIEGKFVFFDSSGNLTIDTGYDDAEDFRDGVSEVSTLLNDEERSSGYINLVGRELWSPKHI